MNLRGSPLIAVLLTILISAYITIAALYAALTPRWQVPDEPAHYNYIRSLADGEGLPILESGDYDQRYLERLTSEGFPPELSIARLEYEDHQPPLYYLLATPIFLLSDGSLLPLRLFSVLLGSGLLIVTFGAVRTIFPDRPEMGLIAAGFIALIPQHTAMTAGVNNDTLAELIVAGTLWALLVYSQHQEQPSVLRPDRQPPWRLGFLLGAALLTKTTAYVVVGVAAAAVVIRWRRDCRTLRWATRQLTWMLLPALLVSAPWFVRNGLVYGSGDPLALAQHSAVAAGQPRSRDWLVAYGWDGLLSRMIHTTFQSFWGQFGWMAVPLRARVYQALALLSIVLAGGFLAWLIRQRRPQTSNSVTYHRLGLLALSALFTLLSYGWYNLTFVQHQGRYLFPALVPMATAVGLGLDTLAGILPTRLRHWALSAFFAALAAFDVYCLFKIIIPNL
ncbi:MAG: glycosyltransferase family 39 protein [Anaerolineae bacterium]